MSASIHPSAIVDPEITIAEDAWIGPFAIVERGAVIGPRCRIEGQAIVRSHTTLEEAVSVDSFAVLGGLPQDLSFDSSIESGVRIGRGTVIREGVTVHRSTQAGGSTTIGEKCLLMANAHVAHDCAVGSRAILANNVMLAGHVHVGQHSFLGGGCGIHQFVCIGDSVMVAGNASVTCDVPHYLMVAERSIVTGLNLVGLKRRLDAAAISDLRRCYKAVYLKAGDPMKHAAGCSAETEFGQRFLDFFKPGKRGRVSRSRVQS